MDVESNQNLFDRLFDEAQNDPHEWGFNAWDLRTAAFVLLEAYEQTWGADGIPVGQQNEHLNSPASMLYGCALENTIKGYLILKHGSFQQAMDAYTDAWKKHRIRELADATGITLTTDQKLLLGSLEAFIVWAGRYPIAMKRSQYTIEKQYQAGDHMKPSPISRREIEILEPFRKQLDDAVFARWNKKFDGVLTQV